MTSGLPLAVGYQVPSWTMVAVDPARMKTMAALLRDPYPVHWDRQANEHIGLGLRAVHQGPLNVGYIAHMLMAWAGPTSVRRLTLSFGRPVLDGDHVTAHAIVTAVDETANGSTVVCDVWLQRNDERVVTGTAVVDTTALTHSQFPTDETKENHT